MSHKKAVCYIDGASRGNPGPASAGVAILDVSGKPIQEIAQKIGRQTNNIAEYSALLFGLQAALKLGIEELEIYADSELLVKQMNGEYKVKEDSLKLLHLLARNLQQGFKSVKIEHIPREKNKLADKLANQALDDALL